MAPVPPTPIITLIRHGQALHNVSHDYTIPDPVLTELGESQCSSFYPRFSNPHLALPPPDIIFTSPLKRTVQTALLGFAPLLEFSAAVNDEDKKTKVVAVPELQETSAMPCDTGSETKELKKMFGDKVEWDWLDEDGGEVGPRKEWTSKKGPWAGDGNALEKRARWVRRWLKKVSEEVPTRQKEKQRHIVCVLHGGFLHYLTEDWSGHNKVAGTGWANTEFRTYVLEEEEDGNVKLVETEGSRASREDIPLGYTEKKQLLESVTKN